MFARFEVLNISDHLHFIAAHCERDRASDLASGFWLQSRGRLRHILRLREPRKRTQSC